MTTATVTALSVDLKGKIWAAVEGQGLAIWDTDSNRWYKPKKQPYRYIDKMVADNKQGVWLMPGDREHSRGLVLHDGIDAQWFNPPSRTLEAPIDLAMAKDGSLWIGTAFDGLYQLTVKSL